MSFTITRLSFSVSRVIRCFASALAAVASLIAAVMPAHAHSPDNAPRSTGGGASIASVKQLDKRTQDIMVHSSAMRSNIPVRVILPKSRHSKKKAKFPVLYMLHGGDDDYTSWTRETDVEKLAENADVLVVMPDGGEVRLL